MSLVRFRSRAPLIFEQIIELHRICVGCLDHITDCAKDAAACGTESNMPKSSGQPEVRADHDMIGHIYASSIEPERFEQLLESWDLRVRQAGFSGKALSLFADAVFATHLDLATKAMPLAIVSKADGPALQSVSQIKSAAFVCSVKGKIGRAHV